MSINTKADYKFRAVLSLPGNDRPAIIPCQITLPKTITDRPELIFLPEEDIMKFFRAPYLMSLHAKLGEAASSITISATGVRFGEGHQQRWGDGLDERQIVGNATSLIITRPGAEPSKPAAHFYVTDCILLTPWDLVLPCHDGTVKVEKSEAFKFQLHSGATVVIESEYRTATTGKRRITDCVTALRVAPVLKSEGASELGSETCTLKAEIDQFLLLVSLAAGRRAVCPQIIWVSEGNLREEYRMDRWVPLNEKQHSWHDCLIPDLTDARAFFRVASLQLNDHPEVKLLQNALAAATLFDSETISMSYLRLFSAFESLVLVFRRTTDLEFCIPEPATRKTFERTLKKFVSEHALLKDEIESRSYIHDNLVALSRVPLKRAAEKFFQCQGINTNDIWPIFGSTGLTLIQIRNLIAHGDAVNEQEWRYILIAQQSLRILVQRCLLSLLGWDYQKSRAHVNTSGTYAWTTAYKELSMINR